jgi:hypothetical protein
MGYTIFGDAGDDGGFSVKETSDGKYVFKGIYRLHRCGTARY